MIIVIRKEETSFLWSMTTSLTSATAAIGGIGVCTFVCLVYRVRPSTGPHFSHTDLCFSSDCVRVPFPGVSICLSRGLVWLFELTLLCSYQFSLLLWLCSFAHLFLVR